MGNCSQLLIKVYHLKWNTYVEIYWQRKGKKPEDEVGVIRVVVRGSGGVVAAAAARSRLETYLPGNIGGGASGRWLL